MASDKTEADIRRDICKVSDDLTEVDTAIQNWLTSNMDTGTYMIDGATVSYTTAKGYASAIAMGANALPMYDTDNNNQTITVKSGIAVWRYTPLFTMANTGFNDGDATTAGHFPTAQAGKYFRLIENSGGTAAEIHTRYLPDFTGLGFDGSMSAALTGATEGNNVIIASDGTNLRLSHETQVLSFNRILMGTKLANVATDGLDGMLLTVANQGRNLQLVARSSVVTGGSGGSDELPTAAVKGQVVAYNPAGTDTDGDGVPDLVAISQPYFTEAGFDHTDANLNFPLQYSINGTTVDLVGRVFTLRTEAVDGVMRNIITSAHRNDLFNSVLGTRKLRVPPDATSTGSAILGANSLLVVNQALNGLIDVPVGTAGQVLTVGATPGTDPLTWTSLPTFPDFTGLATLVAHQNVVVGTGGNLAVESFTASFNRILNTALVLPTAADATTNQGMLLTVDNTGKKFNFTAPSMLMAQSQLPTVDSDQEHKHLAVYNATPLATATYSSRWEFVPNWSHLGFDATMAREFPEESVISGISVDTSTAVALSGLMVGFRAGTSESNLSAYRITDLFNTLLPATKQFQHAVGAQVATASLATHNNLLLINSTSTGFIEATRRDIINHSLDPDNQFNQDRITTRGAANIAKAGYLMEVNGSHQRLKEISKRAVFNDALAATSKLQLDVETGLGPTAQLNTNEVAAAGSLMRVTSDQRSLEAITPRSVFNLSLATTSRLRENTDSSTTTDIAPAGAILEVSTNRQTLTHNTLRDKMNSEIFGTTSANQLNTANAGMFLVIENEDIGGNQQARIGLADAPSGGGGSATIRFHGIRKTLNRVELVSGTDSFDVDQYDDYFLAPMGTTVNNVSGRIRIDLPA